MNFLSLSSEAETIPVLASIHRFPRKKSFRQKISPSAPDLRSPARKSQSGPGPRMPVDDYGQIVSALAHEIRNPLTNINLSVDMLLAAAKDDEWKACLNIISRNSTRINNLLTTFLQYQEAMQVVAAGHSIHQLLEEVLDIARDRILLKNITVRKEYAAGDPQTVCNKPEMQIALTNIVLNAIEAMVPGKGELKLSTSSLAGQYILRIEDNGCGISKVNLATIFKPFATNRPGGLGLGLSTACNALRSNHVAVNVESEEGKGTSFILFFDHISI